AVLDLGLAARPIAWCRMCPEDLAAAAITGITTVNLSLPVSDLQLAGKLGRDRAWALGHLATMIRQARDGGFEVLVGGEDSSRADPDFLCRVVETCEAAGARRFRYADTLGVMEPFAVHDIFRRLRAACGLDLEIHAHDDLGLATANTLAAVRGGATHVSTTVNGLGERAGNAPLEEIVVALDQLYGRKTGVLPRRLGQVSRLVAAASGRPVPVNKSIVGDGVFTHEAGIHVSGLLRDPRTYQALDPASLGRRHRIVLGKHSGVAAILHACAGLGLTLGKDEAETVLARVRSHVVRTKQAPSADDLQSFCAEALLSGETLRTCADRH
ncbi:MAG TPA: homocitrate synthase, partial [Rhodospirillaceae bacterium]|nr:homocitrate synthase [Rhodospirillaceae bacterium]